MSCPNCSSTDIADTTDARGQRVCLDCDFAWLIGGRKRNERFNRGGDWFDRANA